MERANKELLREKKEVERIIEEIASMEDGEEKLKMLEINLLRRRSM